MSNNPPGTAAVTIPDLHGFARLRFQCIGHPVESICTLGYDASGREGFGMDTGGNRAGNIAQAIGEAWLGAFPAAHMTSEWRFAGVDVYHYPALRGQVAGASPTDPDIGVWDQSTPGTANQSTVPCSIALLMKKKTASGGKHNRGRMYLPAGYLTEISVDSHGGIASSAVNVMQADADQFRENLIDAAVGLVPVVLHGMRKVAGTVVSAGAPTVVTKFLIDALIATQRRRLGR